jgi:hypothetical protein
MWQADEQATECFLCHSKFTLFFRRHHCRKCGRVVCGNCSSNRSTYLPSTYVVSPPSQIFLESPHVPHRTCDVCMEELEMLRAALRGGEDRDNSNRPSSSSRRRRRRSKYDETLIQTYPSTSDADVDDANNCPVCGKRLEKLANDEEREQHIIACVERAEFSGASQRRNNRMVVRKLTPDDKEIGGECLICFEEYLPDQKVGRLECLCVFHERCILDWFSRKGPGSCPVHTVHK